MLVPDRKLFLTVMIRVLRGIEGMLTIFGWDRLYLPPAKAAAIFSEGKSEAELAQYQKNQGRTNNCAVYSISAALRMLGDQPPPGREGSLYGVDYDAAVVLSNSRAVIRPNLFATLRDFLSNQDLRLWPNGPVAPREQAILARELAAKHRIPVRALAMRGTPEDLLRYLAMPNTHVLVSFGWSGSDLPHILHPDGKFRLFGRPEVVQIGSRRVELPFTAHTMLLAAYDPNRHAILDGQEVTAPWGFINSWVDAGEGLYWMTEVDFRKAWRFVIPFVGRQKMVVLQRA